MSSLWEDSWRSAEINNKRNLSRQGRRCHSRLGKTQPFMSASTPPVCMSRVETTSKTQCSPLDVGPQAVEDKSEETRRGEGQTGVLECVCVCGGQRADLLQGLDVLGERLLYLEDAEAVADDALLLLQQLQLGPQN